MAKRKRELIGREAVTREVAFQRQQLDGHVIQVQTLIDNATLTHVAQQRAERLREIIAKAAADVAMLESELEALDAEHDA